MNTFSSLGFGAIISFLGQEEDMLPKVSSRARDLPSFKVQKSGEVWGFPLLLQETQGTGAFEVLETQCPHQVLSLPFFPNLLFYFSFKEPAVAVKVTPVHFVTQQPRESARAKSCGTVCCVEGYHRTCWSARALNQLAGSLLS